MSRSEINFEVLNAYVDGELDAAQTADVARSVADDPYLAEQVAALSRLRSTVAEGVEAPELTMPAPAETGGTRTALVASIAFFLFVAGSVLMYGLERNFSTQWLQYAWQMHRGWSIDTPASKIDAGLLPVGYIKAVAGAYVPDLSAAKLSLVHSAVQAFPGDRKALLAGYRGSRGCKITLITFPRPLTLGETLRHDREGQNEAFAWRVGALAYVIMSDGMDSNRFRLLAESVRQTSRRHLPFDKQTQMALRQSRDNSAPCLA